MEPKPTEALSLPKLMNDNFANTVVSLTLLFMFLYCGGPAALARNGGFSTGDGNEHPIVVPFPTRTIADRLLEANTIVLAKESAEKPFTYKAHTAIKGSLTDTQEIDLFMNSFNRRLLKKFPERNIVLIRLGDGEKQTWETVGSPQPEMETLVNDILENANNWEKDPKARMDFFAERIGHANSTIHKLAYLEIGRAPYSEIRKLKGVIPSHEIHSFLQKIQYAEWHALYILLLGLSDDRFDQKVVKDAFHDAARSGIYIRSAAWATAYLEINPEEALTAIKREYFRTPGRELKELDAMVAAVSAHGSEGHVHLRDSIVEGYKTLLENYPDLVAPVIKDLMEWKRWDLVETVRNLMKDPPPSFNYMSSILVRRYVKAAQGATDR